MRLRRTVGGVLNATLLMAALLQAVQTPPSEGFWPTLRVGATVEGYYQYDWNRPPDRVIPLRAYDTRANVFGLQLR